MRPDRPLIVSVLLLAAGLGLIFGYCDGNIGLNASYPLSAASFKLSLSTFGPAAVGGPVLTLLGLLLLVWALFCAILDQIGLVGTSKEHDQGPLRLME
jgi:hypothetical protein